MIMRTLKYYAASIVAVLFLSQNIQAQDDDGPNTKGEAGDISIGFNYDLTPNLNFGGVLGGGAGGASAGNNWRNDAFGNAQIFGRYYLSNDLAIRASLGLNSVSTTNVTKDSTWGMTEGGFEDDSENNWGVDGSDSIPYQETETNTSQFNFSIAPGIEKHISTDNNLDPYIGAQIPLAFLGSTSRDSSITKEGYQTDPSNGEKREVSYEYSDDRETPGGFGWGIQGIVGFNWFVDDKVAIGMEYTLGFMNTSTGGEVTGEGERSAESGLSGIDNELTNTRDTDIWDHNDESSNGGIQTMSRGGINVSIFF